MNYVTLEFDGEEKSFADWGISLNGAVCQRVNQAPDTYSFAITSGSLGDEPLFAFGDKIIVRRGRASGTGDPDTFTGGYIAFIGYRTNSVEDARPEYQGVRYTFQNAWYFIEQTTYQQSTANWTGSLTPVKNFPYTSDVELFMRWTLTGGPPATGMTFAKITNGQQIHDILQHVLTAMSDRSLAAPFVIGTTGDPTDPNPTHGPQLDVPSYQVRELTCAAAIQKCLELSPDVTAHFDYNWDGVDDTTIPKLHFKNKTNLDSVTLALANGVDHKSLNLTPRWDLVPDRVIIYYRYIADLNGTTYITYGYDAYPEPVLDDGPTAGPGLLIQTIDMQGRVFKTIEAFLRVRSCDCNNATLGTRLAWWKEHHADFKDTDRVTVTAIEYPATIIDENDDGTPGSSVSLGSYPNELLDSVVADWMYYNGDQVVTKTVRITTNATVIIEDKVTPGAVPWRVEQKTIQISTRVVLTNGIGGTYTNILASTLPEDQPVGIAQAVYESLALQWQGEHIRVENQVTAQVGMNNKLNLSGGNAAWLTMAAQIQSIVEDEGTGETTVSIGPARHLSAADLRAVQFYNRNRQARSPDAGQRTTGLP